MARRLRFRDLVPPPPEAPEAPEGPEPPEAPGVGKGIACTCGAVGRWKTERTVPSDGHVMRVKRCLVCGRKRVTRER